MSAEIVRTGDTSTFQAAFKDPNQALIDPDSNDATFTVYYDETGVLIASYTMTRVSQGVYTYDWLIPSDDGVTYIVEMKGLFSTKPQLQRMKVKAKFRP